MFTSQHILEEYSIVNNLDDKIEKVALSDSVQQSIYNSLLLEQLNLDEISRKLGLGVTEVSSKISLMEIGGYIVRNHDGKYRLR